MKYLLQAIEAKRDLVKLSDGELRKLLVEVRSGKDDRIEFIEAMTRLLEELRSSEHAAAFLTKVAKRDAPDYYDVIKNPMDLGTMLRNVKSGRYKSKAQFMRDLDLVWDNCLTYNSEPTHPLRRSVQILRAKANHLLTYVNDTNDVKEALSQWQASSSSSSAGPGSEAPASAGLSWSDSPLHGLNGIAKGASLANGRPLSATFKRAPVSLQDVPFEQRPAVLRNVQGMSTFTALDGALSHADDYFQRKYLSSASSTSIESGPSQDRALRTFDMEPGTAGGMGASAAGEFLRSLDVGTATSGEGILRSALTMGEEVGEGAGSKKDANGTMTNGVITNGSLIKQGKQKEAFSVPYPLQATLDGIVDERFQLGAWWNSISRPTLLACGISPLPTSVQLEPRRMWLIGEASRKKRRKRRQEKMTNSHTFGGVEALERNVSTIAKLRRTHAKFGALTSHIEHEEPIPAALAVVSSDEESDDGEQPQQGGRSKEDGGGSGSSKRRRYKEMDMPADSMHDPRLNPYAKLASEGATDLLESKVQFLLAHAGFEGAQRAAADVVTDVASEYIMNLGRTLRMYTDQFAHEMSVEEIILHALFENGGMDVRSLESYIVDDVLRYGSKMADLLRKLQSAYRDTLHSANFTMEDEAYFAENAEGGNDQIMSGTYAQEMGDDFFGFKEMGLDKELGLDMSQLMVPSKLFNRAGASSSGGPGRPGMLMKGGVGAGAGGSSSLLKGPGTSAGAGGEVVMFEPPPAFVPITEAAISAQIGLLQPFFRELLRLRGQWQKKSRVQGMGNAVDGEDGQNEGEEEEEEQQDEDDDDRNENGEGQQRRQKKSEGGRKILVLPEEEMERQRYKVPPNGKMPKRAMRTRGHDQQQGNHSKLSNAAGNKERAGSSTAAATPAAAAAAASGSATGNANSNASTGNASQSKSKSSKKKKKEAS